MSKVRCVCVIRHAVTAKERERAQDALEIARGRCDPLGALLAVASLSPCPRARKAA